MEINQNNENEEVGENDDNRNSSDEENDGDSEEEEQPQKKARKSNEVRGRASDNEKRSKKNSDVRSGSVKGGSSVSGGSISGVRGGRGRGRGKGKAKKQRRTMRNRFAIQSSDMQRGVSLNPTRGFVSWGTGGRIGAPGQDNGMITNVPCDYPNFLLISILCLIYVNGVK